VGVLDFVFVGHLREACEAALLFSLGALLAWPAARFGPQALVRLPVALFRRVMRLFGTRPGLVRTCGVIFGFNGAVMFLSMASGIRPWPPQVIAAVTGFDIGAILFLGEAETGVLDPDLAADGWIPGPVLTALCGLAVLALELPCFCYSIGMGMSLGREVLEGQVGYGQGLAPRALAYVQILLPLLWFSAVCEGIAVRGMRGRA